MTSSFEKGDSVYIGEPAPHKVHWVVEEPPTDGLAALLRSPMSGRTQVKPAADLTLHTKGSPT